MALIFLFSSFSNLPATPMGVSDVGVHAAVYGLLAVLVLRALTGAGRRDVKPRNVVVAFLLSVMYGLSDEYHQSFVAGRISEARDLIADTAGAGIGVGLIWLWSIVLSTRNRSSMNDL